MNHLLPSLPYAIDALAPHISKETLEYHYGKHHATYVTNLNNLIKDTKYQDMSLEAIIANSDGAIFNNAAQIWNHTFYWHSLSPNGGGEPVGAMAAQIVMQWGSFEVFKQEFTKACLGAFGSAWVWLAKEPSGKLVIKTTANAASLLNTDFTPVLVCDVWEHAYYIDYRNSRANYITSFWKLVNWDFASMNFA